MRFWLARTWALGLGGLFALVGSAVVAPSVGAAALANLARVELLKASACVPDGLACQPPLYPPTTSTSNQEQIERAASWLRQAVEWSPDLTGAYRDLAVAEFALGRRAEATGWLAVLHQRGQTAGPGLEEGYAGRLMRARLAAEAGDWGQAVAHYRMGLILGAERAMAADEQEFLVALASFHRGEATSNPDQVRPAYLAGKYLVRAGDWSAGAHWLEQALQPRAPSAGLGEADLAGAHISYGLALEGLGLVERAEAQYQAAIGVAPERAEGHLRLAELMHRSGRPLDARLLAALDEMQPRYVLGRQSEDASPGIAVPADLPGGWVLVGFDLDEEALAAGPPVDLVLWWEGPPAASPDGEGWVKAGARWVQRRHVTNLAPNAGFEWGIGPNGLPEGFIWEAYSAAGVPISTWAPHYGAPASPAHVAAVERIATTVVARSGRAVTAAELRNGPSGERSFRLGLVGIPVQVDSAAIYLQAGWIRDSGRRAHIGRLCATGPTTDEPSYIVFQHDDNPRGVWVHWSGAATPLPEKSANRCALFLLNYESEQPAQFADLLLARIPQP